MSKLITKTAERLKDPFYFMHEILGIKYLTAEQKEIVISVWNNKYTDVRSCHSVGKTFIEAAILITFLFQNVNSVVVSTAPTGRQVEDLLWSNVNNLYRNAKVNLGGRCLTTDLKVNDIWYATGISTTPGKENDSATKIQGYHAPKILILVDEAYGVDKRIFEALDGVASSEGAKSLCVGNPMSTNNAYAQKLFTTGRKSITISAFNHPNVVTRSNVVPGAVSFDWVIEKIRDWCEVVNEQIDKTVFEYYEVVKNAHGELQTTGKKVWYKPNDLFLWKVLGEYPEQAVDSLVTYRDVLDAMERGRNINILNPDDPARAVQVTIRHGALDVARFGTNKSVFCKNINSHFTFKEFYKMDLADLTEQAIMYITENRLTKFSVDCDGIGGGVYDNLKKWKGETKNKVELFEIHGGASPLELKQTEEFINLRSQMYWFLKTDIEDISIEYKEDVLTGLSSIKYSFNTKGKIQIESKDEFKKRFQRSSDYEDALIYCNSMKYTKSYEPKMAFI